MHSPLWWLAPPPFPRSSVGRQKESALMGRLGALLRPTWRSYAGPPQGHYNAPLCCERLMKGMLRGVLFCPLNRGKSGAARIGGGERSEPVSRMVILPYDTESKSRNVLASPLGEEGHEVAKGVQANWIHRGASRPANPVRRHPAKSVCTRVRMIMILDVDVTAERRHYNTHRPLKGKRLTTFCASLALLQNVFAVHLRAIPQPSGPKAPSNLRTLGPKTHPS